MRLEAGGMNNKDWFNLVGKQVKIMGTVLQMDAKDAMKDVDGDVIAMEGKVISVNLTSHWVSVEYRRFCIGKIDILETVEPELIKALSVDEFNSLYDNEVI